MPFTAVFPGVPLAVAHGTTRNGNNGGWVRRCGLSASAIAAHVDEDVASDPERTHVAEAVAGIAFEYQVTVSNVGRGSSDIDTIVVADAIPAGNAGNTPMFTIRYRVRVL